MEFINRDDLAEGMRLDDSVHLRSGELVLYRRQRVDDVLLDTLAGAGVTDLALAGEHGEVEALALAASREAVPLGEISEAAVFAWGLYDALGRKLIPANSRLSRHRAYAAQRGGVDHALEPSSSDAASVARRRRRLIRSRYSRPAVSPGFLDRFPPAEAPSGFDDAELASAMVELAASASEFEACGQQLASGLCLDVRTLLDAVGRASACVFDRPHGAVRLAVEMLAGGVARMRAVATAVLAAAAGRASGLDPDSCYDLAVAGAAGRLVFDAFSIDEDPSMRTLRVLFKLADADGFAPEMAMLAARFLDREREPAGTSDAAKLLCAVNDAAERLAAGTGGNPMVGFIKGTDSGRIDPGAARHVLRSVGFYPAGATVRLSTGEIARVVGPCGDNYERPYVKVIRTSAGLEPSSTRLLALSRLPGIRIEGMLGIG